MRRAVFAIVIACGAAGAAGAAAAQPLAPFAPLPRPAAEVLASAAFLDRERFARNQTPYDDDALDVTLVRSWPRAVRFAEGGLEFDVSPHAGVGVSRRGGQAEAGAMLTVGQAREREAVEALKDIGVRDGGEYGDKGRWYLFAAASGRAVGLNVMRDEGGWNREGWSTDPTAALIGDAHVGVGWRKGDLQSSFGVIHREIKGEHRAFAVGTREDTVAAFTFSIRPQN